MYFEPYFHMAVAKCANLFNWMSALIFFGSQKMRLITQTSNNRLNNHFISANSDPSQATSNLGMPTNPYKLHSTWVGMLTTPFKVYLTYVGMLTTPYKLHPTQVS